MIEQRRNRISTRAAVRLQTIDNQREMMMGQAFQTVLDAYNARAEQEKILMQSARPENALAERDRYLLHVGEDVARFLHALITARSAKYVVEVGTSYGYSTLFLADAVRATGGCLVTLELSEEKQDHARSQLEKAGLAGYVDWRTGDALDILSTLDRPFDFVLLDLWKELYVPCLELIHPRLAKGGIIAADNMLFPEVVRPEAKAYRERVKAKEGIVTALLPIGQGIELSCYLPEDAD